MKRAIYPGSFDPLTNGHLDILKRALKVFDEVILLVADNQKKVPTFTSEERMELLKEATKDEPKVKVDSTHGLTIQYAQKVQAVAMIRGLRAVSDFDYEFQINSANEFINSGIETIFFMTRMENTFISSSTVKELFFQGVDVSPLVPKCVLEALQKKKEQHHK